MVGKWRKVGIARLSQSKKVILLAISALDSHKWLIIDVERLFELIEGKSFEAPILESD